MRLNVFSLWIWLSFHSFMVDSLKFKACSSSSFPPYEVLFFLVIFEEVVEVVPRNGRKQGCSRPDAVNLLVDLYLCIAKISHETEAQTRYLGVVGFFVFPY